ncbi:MAG: hypothetical protein ACI932_000293 [Paracoccaceae bacterium]|jgi:hypothetical protein
MVEIADIKDRETLEAWLNGLPTGRLYGIANVIAARSAWRMVPHWHWYFDNEHTKSAAPDYALALFRCTLTSAVAAVTPTADVKAAGLSAAAAAASAAASTADLWPIIRQDCQASVSAQGDEYQDALSASLWQQATLDPFADEWTALTTALQTDGPHWQFWIDLYERFLRGQAQNWDMLLEIVLLPEEDWKAGPEHLNGLIAGIVERYSSEAAVEKKTPRNDPDTIVGRVLDTTVLRAALADFSHDDFNHLLKMAPFPDDLSELDDAQSRDIAELLELLRKKTQELLKIAEPKNVDDAFKNDLREYLVEVSRPMEDIRPRFLYFVGADLRAASLDDDVGYNLDRHLSRLERLVDQHLDLMRSYFAAAISRVGALDAVTLKASASASEVVFALKDAMDSLLKPSDERFPPLQDIDRDVLFDRFAEIEELSKKLEHPEESISEARKERFRARVAALSVTVLRAAAISGKVVLKSTDKVLDVTSKVSGMTAVNYLFFPEATVSTIQRLLELVQNIPWF